MGPSRVGWRTDLVGFAVMATLVVLTMVAYRQLVGPTEVSLRQVEQMTGLTFPDESQLFGAVRRAAPHPEVWARAAIPAQHLPEFVASLPLRLTEDTAEGDVVLSRLTGRSRPREWWQPQSAEHYITGRDFVIHAETGHNEVVRHIYVLVGLDDPAVAEVYLFCVIEG